MARQFHSVASIGSRVRGLPLWAKATPSYDREVADLEERTQPTVVVPDLELTVLTIQELIGFLEKYCAEPDRFFRMEVETSASLGGRKPKKTQQNTTSDYSTAQMMSKFENDDEKVETVVDTPSMSNSASNTWVFGFLL